MHFASISPTPGEWFTQQVRGVKHMMGVVRFQNEALNLEMVLALDNILKREWHRSNSDERGQGGPNTILG